jgi:uncharacterized membrane-anchored protein
MLKSDPQRDGIWQELHARPYVRFSGPAEVLRVSFLIDEAAAHADRANLTRFTQVLGLSATYETPRHCIFATTIAQAGRLVLSWERHTEFVAYTFFLYDLTIPFRPFGFDWRSILPSGWLEGLGTPPLVATRIAVDTKKEMPATLEGLMALFEGHTVNGSRVMRVRADVYSCYRIHQDGFGRVAVFVDEMSPQDLGRTVERLLGIEDFYHLTLLSLPLARELKPDLAIAEQRMVVEMDALRRADSLEGKRTVLDALLELAAEVEHVRARVSNRFAGSSAYSSLLESRFADLREEKIEHVLRLSRFVMRRVRPAAETYRAILERLANLSERISRAADLLRTRIELHVEEQNQRLLEDADRRARAQLRLQEAIEGLSVFVITYYALGLVGYALKGFNSRGFQFDLDATLGLALPILLVTVWAIARAIRRRFRDSP